MLKIGDFSKLSRVSIRMLRYYDEIGLLHPVSIDDFTGYRYYSEEQLSVVGRISSLKAMGFTLNAVLEILANYDNRDVFEQYLSNQRLQLQKEQEETGQKILLLDSAMMMLRKEEEMKYDVVIKDIPERYVASVRMIIPSYAQEGMAWGVLCSETAQMNLVPADPCLCSVTFHDGEYKESDVEVEAQKTVKGTYQDTEHVKFKTVPAITIASSTYKGSYAQINDANAAVAKWVEENGYEYCGPMFNIYHVSPHETQDPNEYITEVCYPVKRK